MKVNKKNHKQVAEKSEQSVSSCWMKKITNFIFTIQTDTMGKKEIKLISKTNLIHYFSVDIIKYVNYITSVRPSTLYNDSD